MKFFVASDFHADWSTYGVSRFEDVQRAVRTVVQQAILEKADAFFFPGDLCDPDDAPAVLRSVRLVLEAERALTEAGIPSYWMAGNHDVIEDGSGETSLSTMRAVEEIKHGATIIEKPMLLARWQRLRIIALPFTASSHPYDPGAFVTDCMDVILRAGGTENILVLSHLAMPGVQPGEETTEMPRGREVVFPIEEVCRLRNLNPRNLVVIQGHYHQPQTVRPAGLEVHIPGSVARLTFGEERNKPGYLKLVL